MQLHHGSTKRIGAAERHSPNVETESFLYTDIKNMEKAQFSVTNLEGVASRKGLHPSNLNINKMNLKFVLLSHSQRGRVFRHEDNLGKICVMFNNITQSFSLHEFFRLKKSIEEIDLTAFFKQNERNSKLHIRTDFRDLFFSFTEDEIYDLRNLLLTAEFKLEVEENLKSNVN